MLGPDPIATKRGRRPCAVHPIVLLSLSAEDPAKDYQKRPRRWSTVALDVLSTRRASQQSVHFAKRMATSSPAAKLRSAGPCSHGSSATCWAVAPAPGALHPAEKSARCARAEAPRLWFVVGRRHDHTMVWMAADACVPRRNAARWMLARSCVMSRYSRDYAQRV